ncbi:MAG: ABC transporter ATP-binding protein [Treponema sp.]
MEKILEKENPVILLKNICRIYQPGNVAALSGINLEIQKGEFVAVMGHSGSGKSTLLNILGCLDKADSGSYELDGIETSALSDKESAKIRSQKIGFVFQSFNLISRNSALENVERPLFYVKGISQKERRQRAENLLAEMGLEKRKDHLPNQLSGGQQQRVAIARAMINNPSFILADEPTGNLDTKMSEEIMKLFQNLNRQGKTIVMVTHEREYAEFCNRIVTLKDGTVISDEKIQH